MAKPETPKSDATIRAERKADQARITQLEQECRDEKRARDKLKWGREWGAHDKKRREKKAEIDKLRKKKYG